MFISVECVDVSIKFIKYYKIKNHNMFTIFICLLLLNIWCLYKILFNISELQIQISNEKTRINVYLILRNVMGWKVKNNNIIIILRMSRSYFAIKSWEVALRAGNLLFFKIII